MATMEELFNKGGTRLIGRLGLGSHAERVALADRIASRIDATAGRFDTAGQGLGSRGRSILYGRRNAMGPMTPGMSSIRNRRMLIGGGIGTASGAGMYWNSRRHRNRY